MPFPQSHRKEHVVIGIVLFLIALMLFVIVSGDQGLSGLRKLREEKESETRKIRELQIQNYDTWQKIQRLKGDRALIESIARTDLGMVRKDELVFRPQESPILPMPHLPAKTRQPSDD